MGRQYDIYWRAALMLEKSGVPERLLNRISGKDNGVSSADWKAACSQADDVLKLIETDTKGPNEPVNVGKRFRAAGYGPGAFSQALRNMVARLMEEQKISSRQAFDQIKETQPLFWTLAILDYEREPAAMRALT
jgi:hypothetical protein